MGQVVLMYAFYATLYAPVQNLKMSSPTQERPLATFLCIPFIWVADPSCQMAPGMTRL